MILGRLIVVSLLAFLLWFLGSLFFLTQSPSFLFLSCTPLSNFHQLSSSPLLSSPALFFFSFLLFLVVVLFSSSCFLTYLLHSWHPHESYNSQASTPSLITITTATILTTMQLSPPLPSTTLAPPTADPPFTSLFHVPYVVIPGRK